jgi:cytochrome c-type biogenesis protein
VSGAFAEAIRATTQPCTFLLIVPILVVVLATGARVRPTVAAIGAAIVGGWLLASNWLILDGWQLQLSAVSATAAIVAVALAPFVERLVVLRGDRAGVPTAAGVALLATMWWRPCVGEQLGSILTNAQTGLVGQIPGMTAYLLGAMTPVAIVALAVNVAGPTERRRSMVGVTAALVGVVVVGALAVGRHDSVVVTLARWTLD